MKIAFSVTGPDLARVLSNIARQANGGGPAAPRRMGDKVSTVSPAARRALAEDREADDGQS